ncbi:hypothetical protein HPCU_03485 [Helicobacter pylori Cuz20]|uniref:Uncharacterized protein n=1 Tax=Helicobacter pylori (strain Cuz20) TaxID=765964 RepID=A0AB32X7K0_HELPC|nr:hypothetical protein HPCU_03485 [Helicobacter pylori Cuz20]
MQQYYQPPPLRIYSKTIMLEGKTEDEVQAIME